MILDFYGLCLQSETESCCTSNSNIRKQLCLVLAACICEQPNTTELALLFKTHTLWFIFARFLKGMEQNLGPNLRHSFSNFTHLAKKLVLC